MLPRQRTPPQYDPGGVAAPSASGWQMQRKPDVCAARGESGDGVLRLSYDVSSWKMKLSKEPRSALVSLLQWVLETTCWNRTPDAQAPAAQRVAVLRKASILQTEPGIEETKPLAIYRRKLAPIIEISSSARLRTSSAWK